MLAPAFEEILAAREFLAPYLPKTPLIRVNAICELLGNPALAARVGQAARQSINERFSTTRMVAATEELYRTLLERRSPVTAPASTEFACK